MTEQDFEDLDAIHHLTERGEHRGPAAVLAAARADSRRQGASPIISGRRILTAAATVAILICTVALANIGSNVSTNFQKVSDNLPDDDPGGTSLANGRTLGVEIVELSEPVDATVRWGGTAPDQPVLFVYVAPGCADCADELADLAAAQRELDHGFDVVAVVGPGTAQDAVVDATAATGLVPSTTVGSPAYTAMFGVTDRLPHYGLVSPGGVMHRTRAGTMGTDELVEFLEEFVGS